MNFSNLKPNWGIIAAILGGIVIIGVQQGEIPQGNRQVDLEGVGGDDCRQRRSGCHELAGVFEDAVDEAIAGRRDV